MPCELAKQRLKERMKESKEDRECLKCIIEDICPDCGGDLKTLFTISGESGTTKRCKKCFTEHYY